MSGGRALPDRLRANLRAAEIPASDADIDRVVSDGYLARVEKCLGVLRTVDGDMEPDYLALWAAESLSEQDAGRTTEPASGPADVVRGAAAASGGDGDPPAAISAVAPLLRDGLVSPVELTERALARMAERDAGLNAFQLVLAEPALDAARRAESEIRQGTYRSPLHGVPIAVKDLLAMTGTVTTAGSKVLAENVTSFDAAAVERLEDAGAIIVGKTRLSEFAYWPGSTNPHYGPTSNPHDPTRDTGGSSSGSAAAVADGMVYAALGSDTGGSIRIPAALCGVVGLKPTFGRVSLFGCAPLSWSLDHLGPLTRTVEDAALVLAALSGHDGRDPRTRRGSVFGVPADLHGGVAGLRLGVLGADGSSEPLGSDDAIAQWQSSTRTLTDAGATLVEVDLPEMAALRMASLLILAVEASAFHAPTLRTHYEDYGEFCRGRLLGAFAYSAEDFIQAQRFRQIVRRKWDSWFDRIDVLSTPSQPDVAPALGVMASVRFTNPFNALGWPAVSVPYGTGAGALPLATQLVGKPWDEATVLRVAQLLEMARRHD